MLGAKKRIRRCAEEFSNRLKVCKRNLSCTVAAFVVVKIMSRKNKNERSHLIRHSNALILLEPVCGYGNGNRETDTLHLPKVVYALRENLRLADRTRGRAVSYIFAREHKPVLFIINHSVNIRLIVGICCQRNYTLIILNRLYVAQVKLFAKLTVFVSSDDLLQNALLSLKRIFCKMIYFPKRNISEKNTEIRKRHFIQPPAVFYYSIS